MLDWIAEITPDGQRKQNLTFFAADMVQARAFVERHLSFFGGEVHQIRQVDYSKEVDPFETGKPRAVRKTLGGY